MTPLRLGIIGCGNISPLYFEAARRFAALEVVACSDLNPELARTRAATYGVEALATDALLEHPDIDLVVNLTVPSAHAEVAMRALEAGKHVYNEKPLATELADAKRMLALAEQQGLRVACAPSTFLGASVQTCLKLLDDGAIGEPVAGNSFVMSRGMEHWHPNPAFFYQPGAGPMFDVGPYHLVALVALLGPVQRVSGAARISFAERVVTSQPHAGTRFAVTTPTHIASVLEFVSGPIVTLVTSFDVTATELPRFELYGSAGTISLAAPNAFEGPVRVKRLGADWQEVPLVHPYDDTRRDWGLALADLADAILTDRPHLASGEMGYHVLEVMHATLTAPLQGRHIVIESRCERPSALLAETAWTR